MTDLPKADDVIWTDQGLIAFSHHVGSALSPVLKARGLWDGRDDILERMRDVTALTKAAIEAMHSWPQRNRP